MVSFPYPLIEAALVGEPNVDLGIPCVFRDASVFAWASDCQPIAGSDFRAAVDRRSFNTLRAFRTHDCATAVVNLRGRQLGTLGRVVPTGRAFSSLAHVFIALENQTATQIVVESDLLGQLTGGGEHGRRLAEFGEGRSAERLDLLAGDIAATYWARAWSLPPRLARLAVLLMAGVSTHHIGERSALSLRSVRTYTEELLARAGIHNRSALVLAALRDGAAPGSQPRTAARHPNFPTCIV